MQSNMVNRFNQVPSAQTPRSSFDMNHRHTTTIDVDYLYPIYVEEALPGDTFNVNMTGFARLNTPIFPIMDNMTMQTFFFEVPTRLVWANWRRFMGERYPDPIVTGKRFFYINWIEIIDIDSRCMSMIHIKG